MDIGIDREICQRVRSPNDKDLVQASRALPGVVNRRRFRIIPSNSRHQGALMMLKKLRYGLIIAMAVGAAAAQAHDFFLLPDHFTAAAPGRITLKASVSGSFPTLENVVPADRVGRLHAHGAGRAALAIAGPGANALNLTLHAPARGLIIAGVSALPRDVEYGEDRIGVILEEYSIDPSTVARLSSPRVLRVSSRRFAKTIVCVTRCSDRSAARRPMGVDLEFVGAGRGADHFVLLAHGRPLARHSVALATSDGRRRHLRTDAAGAVHLPSDARGSVMLFAALMEPPASGERFTLNLSSLTLAR